MGAGGSDLRGCHLSSWWRPPETLTRVVRVPGTLLAVAITVGLLARWMREGWEIQHELTFAISVRERRLAVLESSARDLENVSEERALEVAADAAGALGFDAVTAQRPDATAPFITLGSTELIAADDRVGDVETGSAMVTVWTEGGRAGALGARRCASHTPRWSSPAGPNTRSTRT